MHEFDQTTFSVLLLRPNEDVIFLIRSHLGPKLHFSLNFQRKVADTHSLSLTHTHKLFLKFKENFNVGPPVQKFFAWAVACRLFVYFWYSRSLSSALCANTKDRGYYDLLILLFKLPKSYVDDRGSSAAGQELHSGLKKCDRENS